jgi:hypothetical protein
MIICAKGEMEDVFFHSSILNGMDEVNGVAHGG